MTIPLKRSFLGAAIPSCCAISVCVFASGCSSDPADPLMRVEPEAPAEPEPMTEPEPTLDVTATDTEPEPMACVGDVVVPNAVPSTILLLIDTSGSMEWLADRNVQGDPSKWSLTKDALQSAVSALPPETSVGVVFFPDDELGQPGCFGQRFAVPFAQMGEDGVQLGNIEAALDEINPSGGTPTHDAYAFAVDRLSEVETTTNKYVVLLTDGAPTYSLGCLTYTTPFANAEPLIEAAGEARDVGIRTFVIGSPGSEQGGYNTDDGREVLSDLALAGGTAPPDCSNEGPNFCHYDMSQSADFGAALSDALLQIAGQATGCSFDLPEPPAGKELDLDKVNVLLTGSDGASEPIAKDAASVDDCVEGWRYSEDETELELCQSTCEAVAADPGATINVEIGCETLVR